MPQSRFDIIPGSFIQVPTSKAGQIASKSGQTSSQTVAQTLPTSKPATASKAQQSTLPTVSATNLGVLGNQSGPAPTSKLLSVRTGGAVPGLRTPGMTEEQFLAESQRRRSIVPKYEGGLAGPTKSADTTTTGATKATTTGGVSGSQDLVTLPGTGIRVPSTSIPGAVSAAVQRGEPAGGTMADTTGGAAKTTTTSSTSVGTSGQPYTAPQRGAVNAEQYGSYVRFGEGMYEGMRAKEQKAAAHKPGAGLWALGIDPKDPNAASKAEAYVAKYKDKLGWLTNGTWGRSNVPGYGKLKQMYPNASADKLLDVAYRQAMAESSLPPRDFLEQIIDPLVMTVLAAIPGVGQIAAPMYGAIKKGVEGGPLAALMGGIQGGSALTTIGGYTVPTALISAAGGAINEDLGTALTLASGGAKGLLEGNWSNLAGTGAGKLATELTGNPLYGMLASTAAGKAAAPTGPVAPIVDKSVKPS